MKKIVLVLAMVAMVGAISAQELSLGIKGGVNMSNYYGKDVKDTKMKLGYNVGISADYDFAPNMAIQSGLFLTTKGAKLASTKINQKFGDATISGSSDITANAMYLQVPVHFAYKMDVNPDTRIVLHAGPYVAYGVGGKTKTTHDYKITGKPSDTEKAAFDAFVKNLNADSKGVDTFEKDKGLKPFDAGLGVGVGAEFGQFLVDLGCDFGLMNISRTKGANMKNLNAHLSVGYKF